MDIGMIQPMSFCKENIHKLCDSIKYELAIEIKVNGLVYEEELNKIYESILTTIRQSIQHQGHPAVLFCARE